MMDRRAMQVLRAGRPILAALLLFVLTVSVSGTSGTSRLVTASGFPGSGTSGVLSPTLANLFLTSQGPNLAPNKCESSSDIQTFSYELDAPPTSQDPEEILGNGFDDDQDTLIDEVQPQQLGAWQLEIGFDPALVCVSIEPGTFFANNDAPDSNSDCWVFDLTNPPRKGLGCGIEGKPQVDYNSLELARIIVQPQPVLYSSLRAHKGNGEVAQLLAWDCHLADQHGHPIKMDGCADAAPVTIRWLEGDVDGSCHVSVRDQQFLAFRWGVKEGLEGHLLYNPRFDLEPSGTISSDGDIDIKDVQFVFGRHGSTCQAPIPPQPPKQPVPPPP